VYRVRVRGWRVLTTRFGSALVFQERKLREQIPDEMFPKVA